MLFMETPKETTRQVFKCVAYKLFAFAARNAHVRVYFFYGFLIIHYDFFFFWRKL